jgi:hypothetical protein
MISSSNPFEGGELFKRLPLGKAGEGNYLTAAESN